MVENEEPPIMVNIKKRTDNSEHLVSVLIPIVDKLLIIPKKIEENSKV